MNRPAFVKSENFFVLLFRAIFQRRMPIALRVVLHTTLLLAAALAVYGWLTGVQFKEAMHEQANAVGQGLAIQTAQSAIVPLVANDPLSLNVLLNNLVKSPLVAHAVIYGPDNRVLAEAGQRPNSGILDGQENGVYSAPISVQEVLAGNLRLTLNMSEFSQPFTSSMQQLGILAALLLLACVILSLRLGRSITLPLLQLRVWLRDPTSGAPGTQRHDEIGDLANQLESQLVPADLRLNTNNEPSLSSEDEEAILDELIAPSSPQARVLTEPTVPSAVAVAAPAPAPAPALNLAQPIASPASAMAPDAYNSNFDLDEFDSDSPAAGHHLESRFNPATESAAFNEPILSPRTKSTAVLAFQLGNADVIRQLPAQHQQTIYLQLRALLTQAASLYQATLHHLNDTCSLLLFHSSDQPQSYLSNAVCCGELLRVGCSSWLSPLATQGVHLQIALTCGENLDELAPGSLLLSQPVQNAITLSEASENALLLDETSGEAVQTRALARVHLLREPANTLYVERLLEPYHALLEGHLERLASAIQR